MKNASANYLQIDHEIKLLKEKEGLVILPSFQAWEKFLWTRKYFLKKPEEGYFIWVKKQINFPLFSCVSIAGKKVKQNLQNLMVVEKNIEVSMKGSCSSLSLHLSGSHSAKGNIVLKENSSLNYRHFHSWGQKDFVAPEYNFILEKNSRLDYLYKTFSAPGNLEMKTSAELFEGASCNFKLVADCRDTDFQIKEFLILKEKGSRGQIQLRLVGREESRISALSRVEALGPGQGHLDCQGLLTDSKRIRMRKTFGAGKNSFIKMVPELICKNSKAQITHEASIGKISEEQLNYLRMRGLAEKEAIDLIVNGFLES
jgi:uncharacterized protein